MTKTNYIKSLLILVSCTAISLSCSRSKENQIERKAISFIEDKNFSEDDYKQFYNFLEKSKEKKSDDLKTDGKPDPNKIKAFIEKSAKEKEIQLTSTWKPSTANENPLKFNYNVYIENSGSMDGYVTGTSEFKNDIYNFLADLHLDELKDSLNLFYINKDLLPQKNNAADDDLKDFIERLNPQTFQEKGGNRVTSDFSEMLGDVLDKIDNKNVGILISDFVFSPGDKDATNYLNNQQNSIKVKFGDKIKKLDLSIAIFQLESEFNGTYYNKFDSPIPLNGVKRPYYVWVMGTSNQIQKMYRENLFEFQKHYKNRWIIESLNSANQTKTIFDIDYSKRTGEFNKETLLKDKKNGKWTIADAEYPKRKDEKEFQFTLNVDFRNSMQNIEYFSDPSIYEVDNPSYKLTVKAIDQFELKKNFSHQLTFTTNQLKNESLKLAINKFKTPNWVKELSSTDDRNILTDSIQQKKTFGFSYLIEGIKDGFAFNSKSKTDFEVEIKIKQTSYKWVWLVLFLVAIVVTFLIVLRKYKK